MERGIPGVDVALLLNVTRRLAERRLHTYAPGLRRSAAALVLSFDDGTQRTVSAAFKRFREAAAARTPPHTPPPPGWVEGCTHRTSSSSADFFSASSSRHNGGSSSSTRAASSTSSPGGNTVPASHGRTDPSAFFEYLAQQQQKEQQRGHAHGACGDAAESSVVDADAPSALQLLFLKRAHMDASRWSGQVGFPGGRRDPDDHDDFTTVCREAYETVGLPLQHQREFLCLGRLPDWRLQSRVLSAGGSAGATPSGGLVQARFVFLHVGDLTPAVPLAAHEVESVRWVPLRGLTAAHADRGRVVHPLQSFVSPQDADVRLLLAELLPNTFLTFPSVLLPALTSADASSSPSTWAGAPGWRVWGLTLRSANELLALDNRRPFDWPLVESNSRVLQYGLLYPLHGWYEVLYQVHWWRAWLRAMLHLRFRKPDKSGSATAAPSSASAAASTRWHQVVNGSAMQRRYAVLPPSADALLFAAPERPDAVHVGCLVSVVAFAVFVVYSIAAVIATLTAAVRAAVGVEAALDREARLQAYYDANTPSTVVRLTRQGRGGVVDAEPSSAASSGPGAAAAPSCLAAAGLEAALEDEARGAASRLDADSQASNGALPTPAAVPAAVPLIVTSPVPSPGPDEGLPTISRLPREHSAWHAHTSAPAAVVPDVASAPSPSPTSLHPGPRPPTRAVMAAGNATPTLGAEGTPADEAEMQHETEIEAVMRRYRSTDPRHAS